MAYIGQGIKQGTFKVLDTSGNTYNGSNTTFSLGTQVGAAAQLLVSHDGVIQLPGTDYTLASGGTQITFSTAPASGASIFIVEISGAVGGTVTPSDTSVTADKLNSALLTGHTDIGANLADADLFLVDDGAGGTLRKVAASRIKTYAGGVALDDITTGDAASTLATSAGNITIDAQGNDTDIIFKGTDNNTDTTFLTIDGSEGGDLLVGVSPKISSNGTIANFTNHNASASETALASSDGNEKIRCFNDGKVTIEAGGLEIARFNHSGGDDQLFIHSSGSIPEGGTKGFAVLGQIMVSGSASTSEQDVLRIEKPSGRVGAIKADNSSTTYATSSDYRLKENAVAISDGITRLKTLKPYRFNFKADKDKTVDGFFAHEVTAVPEAITGEKDAMAVETRYTADDAETQGDSPSKNVGDPKTYSTTKIDAQGIDQAKLVPLLTAALQEAITKIETLETKVKALEEG